jgi:hypothetical protein
MPISEDLTKASQTANLVVSDLRAALSNGTAVESIIIMELISDAVSLETRIQTLIMVRFA